MLLLVLSCVVCNCCWFAVCIVVVVCVLLSYVYFLYYVCIAFFFLKMPDCWLEVNIRKVLRPATSAQVFLGFPVSIANAEMVPMIPICHYMLLM